MPTLEITALPAEVTRSNAPRPQSAERIPELDGLRGIAILLVVMCHYVAGSEHDQLGFWWHHILSALTVGWSGVDLFFVLSGFLIGGILLDSRNSPRYFRTFYLRRVHRILPVYYTWVGLYAAIMAVNVYLLPGRLPVAARDLAVAPVYVFFLQNVFYNPSAFQWSWLVVTWSLAVEEQFYLLAPPLIRMISTRRLVCVLSALVCGAPILRFLAFRYLPTVYNNQPMLALPCRADALALGVLAAIAWRRHAFRDYLERHPVILQRCVAYLLVLLTAEMWWLAHPPGLVTSTIGYSSLAVFYTCLLLLALSQSRGPVARLARMRWLRYFGGISYCVYLTHLTIYMWAYRFLLGSQPRIYRLRGAAVTLLAGALTLVVASVSQKYFEKPLIRRGHRCLY